MAELLVQIQDKAGFDAKGNALATRPGDVIVVCEDGWGWTKTELQNPDWRVIKMPGLPVSAVRAMQDPAFAADGVTMVMARAQNLDLSSPLLSPITLQQTPTQIAPVDQTAVLALKVTKVISPVVIG
jgi:hypothetical protein